jgi:predicted transcriptional regulator
VVASDFARRACGGGRTSLLAFTAHEHPSPSPEQLSLVMRLSEHDSLLQMELVDDVLDGRQNITRQLTGLMELGLVPPSAA